MTPQRTVQVDTFLNICGLSGHFLETASEKNIIFSCTQMLHGCVTEDLIYSQLSVFLQTTLQQCSNGSSETFHFRNLQLVQNAECSLYEALLFISTECCQNTRIVLCLPHLITLNLQITFKFLSPYIYKSI